jgi:hypothetical protein
LPNGSLHATWSASTANYSGFGGYDRNPPHYDFGGPGHLPGEGEVYWGFLRDGVNLGLGSSGGDNNQPGYSVDIVGLQTLFTNTPYVIQLVGASDSMETLTNAFIIDATLSVTQSVTYPNTPPVGNVGDTAWTRGSGGGLSTVSGALTNDHVKIIGNRAQHVANPGGFNRASSIAGFIITDKPVVTMSPRPVLAAAHDDVTLRAIAAGVPPLSYQWRNGGVPISEATNTSYSISNITSGGNYDLVITNAFGSATSKVSVLTVDKLLITPATNGTDVVISWKLADAVLQSATNSVTGPYTDVTGTPTSPYTNAISGVSQFYRYRHAATNVNSNPYDM